MEPNNRWFANKHEVVEMLAFVLFILLMICMNRH